MNVTEMIKQSKPLFNGIVLRYLKFALTALSLKATVLSQRTKLLLGYSDTLEPQYACNLTRITF